MSITTTAGHVAKAIDFFNKNHWYAIGKSSAWDDDNSPPIPSVEATDVDEIIGFKRPSTLNLVVPCGNAWVANNNYAIGDYIHANGNIYVCTTAGTSAIEGSGPSETGTGITDGSVVWNYVVAFTGMITCNDSNWGFVATENAYSAKARWVYVQAIIDGNELPLVSYREIGLYSALQVAEGVGEDSAVLLPAQVANNGVLEVISYRKPIPRSDDQKDQLSLVLAF